MWTLPRWPWTRPTSPPASTPATPRPPIAQRGKAKQKRSDLRLVGLGLVLTRDGGIPLVSHAYAGNRPDVTQFVTLIEKLTGGYQDLLAEDTDPHTSAGEVTVVFDAGQNSHANFAYLAQSGLHYIGSVPPNDHLDLLALPASRRALLDADRFPGVTAAEARREIYGADRRVVLTHSGDPARQTGPRLRPNTGKLRPAPASTSWPSRWLAARPAAAATQWKPRSRASAATPGPSALAGPRIDRHRRVGMRPGDPGGAQRRRHPGTSRGRAGRHQADCATVDLRVIGLYVRRKSLG
jgi:hypothetical protein